jgi:hypothetical protein
MLKIRLISYMLEHISQVREPQECQEVDWPENIGIKCFKCRDICLTLLTSKT